MTVKIRFTRPLRKLLKEGGIWLDFKGHKYPGLQTAVQVLKFFYLLSIYLLLWYKIMDQGLGFLLTPSAVFIPLGGVLLTLAGIMLLHFPQIENILDQYELNFSVYKQHWERDIIKKQFDTFEMFINFGKDFCRSFTLLYVFLPLLIDGIRAAMGHSSPYSLPTPLEGYLGSSSSRSLYFYVIILASDVWLWIAMSTSIGIECVIFFMVSYSTTEIKILKEWLRKLEEEGRTGTEVDCLPPWDLKQIVLYHQQIIR